uniref:Uncharacterized protein n=1 Tax=Podoviridae sp. ct7K12 TaxID=2826540 RepID=A0A8S5N7K7_9CAUD|nr:MAG TPA: hypothetical protein [Podoviridae sp. ct7K12]
MKTYIFISKIKIHYLLNIKSLKFIFNKTILKK